MATKKEVTLEKALDLLNWASNEFVPKAFQDEKKKRLEQASADGKKLILEESQFNDPGPDYSALYIEGESTSVVYISGY